ncbi:hypothetical protein SGQ83_10150 [Flavobacterium sp. Fl-318]|uniref:TonB-dependent receptor plug domain-containing protein n=1 Tax=Flavobacterium cupriresistens TaxID=2893885 RepID=A0ABU4RAU7_9FLAO|nr:MULTISPECIES: hypothetical protein [unclassified Flavobacterium]MDX6189713.1 hypothetical protein [Flavobacterium sp. Fl-318]UFH40881.1 hypothetical protein LNP23_13805 [Flavobacterium sp. F-323]
MKKIFLGIISIISFSMYSQNRYELLENGKEKLFLSDSISKMAESGLITNRPIVVVNGIPFRYQDLEKEKLPLSKVAIEKIVAIDKQKGISIYGNFGEAGVLIITTSKTKIFLLENEDESQYYLVDKIKTAFQKDEIANPPLIVIDGEPFKYNKTLNTIVLPIKKEIISDVTILNKNSSNVIYGKDEVYGAIIITTTK